MVRLRGFTSLTNVDYALQYFLSHLKLTALEPESLPLKDSLGRVSAEDIIADRDVPSFDRSTVDGYAVRASDTFGASEFNPKVLRLTRKDEVSAGETIEIWTGSPIPKGADAVVMLEYARKISDEKVEILMPVVPETNISPRGEDMRKGEIAVKRGMRLDPAHIGLLASLGVGEVKCVRRPKVGILSTGSELVEPGRVAKEGEVIDVNRLILSNMTLELGGEPIDLGIVGDDVDEIASRISEGLRKADMLVTTGGVSVGYFDVIPEAVNKLGRPGVVVHGIAMQPGKPTALATINGKPLVLLPGNPVAAMIAFDVFARPLILKMMRIDHEPRPIVEAKLTRRVASRLGTRVFLRVRAYEREGKRYADPIRTKGAGVLTTMTKASGYVIIPEDRTHLDEGEIVVVHLIRPLLREE